MPTPLHAANFVVAFGPLLVGLAVAVYALVLVRRLVQAQERAAAATERLVEALRAVERS